jgi:hypothetical protein
MTQTIRQRIGEVTRNPIFWLFAGLAVLCLFPLVWFLGGKSAVEHFVLERTRPWAVFIVPDDSMPLPGLEAKLSAGGVTICNRGAADWNKVLIQIDQGYLTSLDHLRADRCAEIPVYEFKTESWKRMPPPADLQITRVRVLATVAQTSYAQKSLLTQSEQPPH